MDAVLELLVVDLARKPFQVDPCPGVGERRRRGRLGRGGSGGHRGGGPGEERSVASGQSRRPAQPALRSLVRRLGRHGPAVRAPRIAILRLGEGGSPTASWTIVIASALSTALSPPNTLRMLLSYIRSARIGANARKSGPSVPKWR